MKQRDCFFNKAAPGLPSHPWVIISKPEVDPDNVVIVNLTDAAGWEDQSCVLDASDHPGVFTKRSCVAYRNAKITSDQHLEQARSGGLLIIKPPVSEATLAKILAGIQQGRELPNAHRTILRNQDVIW